MKKTLLLLTILLALLNSGCGPDTNKKETKKAESSTVTFHKKDDPEMKKAAKQAQKTFKFFWKEVTLDFNRIVPALSLACIKLPFSDDPSNSKSNVEHMWVEQIYFDGEKIHCVLINSPNWLKSVKAGDTVECKIGDIDDWMCVLGGKVYGGYSVQVIRSRMSETDRKSYDAKWGLKFPPPDVVNVPVETSEFEPVIAKLLKEQLEKDPSIINSTYDGGRSLLHLEALYGRKYSVKVLLDHGADPTKKCNRGWTPKDYAETLGWTEVIQLLDEKGKKQ